MTPLETTLHALALEARLIKAEKTIAILKEANEGLRAFGSRRDDEMQHQAKLAMEARGERDALRTALLQLFVASMSDSRLPDNKTLNQARDEAWNVLYPNAKEKPTES